MDVQSHSQCHTLTHPIPSKTLVTKNATKILFPEDEGRRIYSTDEVIHQFTELGIHSQP